VNLNLIVDEEVFFGLIDDPRLNYNPAFPAILDAMGNLLPTGGRQFAYTN